MNAVTALQTPFVSGRTTPAGYIVAGAVVATILDLAFAMAWWAPLGVSPQRVLQSIAVNWGWGREAYQGGTATAALGTLLFSTRMLLLSAAYRFAAERHNALTSHPWFCGTLFGLGVYLLNQYIVLPLLAPSGRSETSAWTIACIIAHMLLIGVPLAWFSRISLRERSPARDRSS